MEWPLLDSGEKRTKFKKHSLGTGTGSGMKTRSSTFRSPEMLAPARIPVADGKKMENIPKKLPSEPRQPGTKLAAKISAVDQETNDLC